MSPCLFKTGILSVVLTAAVCYGAPLRKWTNTEGKSFSGTIVDCDGETAKYKVFGRNKLVEIPLSQLCSADRRIAVIEAYKPKYEAALRYLALRQRLWNERKKRGQREGKMFYNAQCDNKGL